MDPKLLYWTAALANMALIVACGVRGVRAIRGSEVGIHRSMMLACVALVALFLASYLAKILALGKEDRSAWTAFEHALLYGHELCIAVMLGGGITALVVAWRFPSGLGPTRPPAAAALPGRVLHRRAGWAAATAALLALGSAIAVWVVMVNRAG